MEMNYPTKIIWRKAVDSGTPVFSGKKYRRLQNLLDRIDELEITHEIRRLDEDFLEWFEPRYAKNISSKDNGQIYDVRQRTLTQPASKYPYYCLTLKERGVIVAGTIFSIRSDLLSVAFKVAENNWDQKSLRPSPSLYTEHLLYQYAIENEKQIMSMGMDTNPYGPNAAIGLAEYKLSAGYLPLLAKTTEHETLNFHKQVEDQLIFMSTENTRDITKATLVTNNIELYDRIKKSTEKIVFHLELRENT